MMAATFLLVHLSLLCRCANVDFIYSVRTPEGFTSSYNEAFRNLLGLNNLAGSFEVLFIDLKEFTENPNVSDRGTDLIVDITYLSETPYSLKELAVRQRIPILVSHQPKIGSSVEFNIFSLPDIHVKAIPALFAYYDWNKFLVFVQRTDENINTAEALNKNFLNAMHEIRYIPSDYNPDSLRTLISKASRQLGYKAYLIIGDGEFALKCEQALLDLNLLIKGSTAVYSSRGCGAVTTDGSLCFIEEGLTPASSDSEYHSLAVIAILQDLHEIIQNSLGTKLSYLDSMQTILPSHQKVYSISLYNANAGSLNRVGGYGSSISINADVTFIGPTYEIPNTNLITIEAAINDGWLNPTRPPGFNNHASLQASHLAVGHINSDSETLSYYSLKLNSLSCGAFEYIYEFSKACIENNTDSLGIAFLHSIGDSVTEGIYQILREINHEFPQISCCTNKNALANKTDFGYYQRIVNSKGFKGGLIAWVLDAFGIKQCAVVYNGSSWGLDYYEPFLVSIKQLGIEILNDEESREIPRRYSVDQFVNYTEQFQTIIDTKARFLVYIDYNPDFLQGFYEMGMRKGDLNIILPAPLDLLNDDGEVDKKVNELLSGAISFDVPSFVGETGQYIYDEIKEKLLTTPTHFHCFAYDSVLMLRDALEIQIRLGEDYTNWDKLEQRIRETRFTGCSGTVQIEASSNDRSVSFYYMYNAQYDEENDLNLHQVIGTYSPTGTVIMSLESDII